MKRVSILAGLLGAALVVWIIITQGTQPSYLGAKTTWYGGLLGHNRIVEGKSLDEISAEANVLAAVHGGPVQYKTEDGKTLYQAYPEGYDKSRCPRIREKVWREGRLARNEIKEVCLAPPVLELPKIET